MPPGQPAGCAFHALLDGQVTLTQAAANGDIAVIDVLRPVVASLWPTLSPAWPVR